MSHKSFHGNWRCLFSFCIPWTYVYIIKGFIPIQSKILITVLNGIIFKEVWVLEWFVKTVFIISWETRTSTSDRALPLNPINCVHTNISLRPSDAYMRRKTNHHYTPAQRSWRGWVYWIHLVRPSVRLSVRPSVRPSVCRRHGFRSISQVCFGISISNFICMLMVAIGRSLLIFSDVTSKMAAWRPYWIFWFPDSNFTLALNINFKRKRHNTYVYG